VKRGLENDTPSEGHRADKHVGGEGSRKRLKTYGAPLQGAVCERFMRRTQVRRQKTMKASRAGTQKIIFLAQTRRKKQVTTATKGVESVGEVKKKISRPPLRRSDRIIEGRKENGTQTRSANERREVGPRSQRGGRKRKKERRPLSNKRRIRSVKRACTRGLSITDFSGRKSQESRGWLSFKEGHTSET